MTPEMQKKMEELLVSDDCGMFSSPERWVGFRRGFKVAHDLMQEQAKPLIEALRLAGTRCEEIHHPKRFQHKSGERCPAEEFIREALKGWE